MFEFILNYGVWVVLLGLNIGLSFIAASMAKKKGYSFGGFWCLGFFTSFLVAIIVAWIAPNLYLFMTREEYHYEKTSAQQNGADARKCANCGWILRSDEVFCSRCGTKAE
jgi:hypothetical protein